MPLPILLSSVDADQWEDVERGEDGWSGNAAVIANNPFHDLQSLEVFVLFLSHVPVKTRGVILPRRVILSGDLRVHRLVDTYRWVMVPSFKKVHAG